MNRETIQKNKNKQTNKQKQTNKNPTITTTIINVFQNIQGVPST